VGELHIIFLFLHCQTCRMGNSFAHAALETAWAGKPAHPTACFVLHRRSVFSAFCLAAKRSLNRDLMLKNPPIVTTIERQVKIPRLRKKKNVQILIQSILITPNFHKSCSSFLVGKQQRSDNHQDNRQRQDNQTNNGTGYVTFDFKTFRDRLQHR